MAFLALTKKAASVLNIDIRQTVVHTFSLPALEDWVVDIIWPDRSGSPGILFYNKATGFAMALNPAEYTLKYCLTLVMQQLTRFLKEQGLEDKLFYFNDLFSVIHLCRNNDPSATGYMTQSKFLVNCWLEEGGEHRVDNSYDLMLRINQNYRKVKGVFSASRMDDFLVAIEKITADAGIIMTYTPGDQKHALH
jgi:hypothetical protein